MEKEKSKKTTKTNKIWKFLSNTVTTLLFVLLISVTCLVIITRINGGEPEIFGHQLKVVLSGSMEPTFQTGSIIAVESYSQDRPLEKDEIITFKEDENKLITHRIIDIVQTDGELLYETKGDNNDAADRELVKDENVVATYSDFTIPYAGYLLHTTQTPLGSALLLIIPGVLLLGYGVMTTIQIIIELDRKSKRNTKQVTDDS